MKAYLVRNPAALPPFQKPAAQVRLHRTTVGSRLRTQLVELGCQVVDVDAREVNSIDPGSLVVQDDVVASSQLLRAFLSAIPDRRRNYQCEIDTARYTFTCLSEVDAPPTNRALPLYYLGDDPDASAEPLRMSPRTLLELARELPARVDQISDMRAYVIDYYGVHIEHWFDLLTASALYCREFAAERLRPFHRVLPHWLVTRVASWAWFRARQNSIGRRTRIHPTAILEGCVVGDDVVIGPFAYLRSAVIGDGAVIRERSTVTMAFVGEGAFVMGGDIANSYLGAESAIFAPALYNVVFGERGLLGGAGGFADFLVGSGTIPATIDGAKVASHMIFLGSGVGDDCFVGTNMIFAPGQTIPDGTKVFDNGLVKFLPTAPGGAYVVAGSDVIQVPHNFLGSVGP